MAEPPDPLLSDTIAAISTPPGRGGIGIVRLSGPAALTVTAHLLDLSHPLTHARARRAKILDPSDPTQAIDDALVTAFLAPRSYTGEDVVEIAAHGSPIILDTLLRSALDHAARLNLPLRLATPGEFTQRAFLSGRLDLTQAEAVHDLIAAHTLDQARTAAQQLGGALSRRVAPAKESLLYLIALLEAGMDFASGELDDVDVVPPHQIASSIQSIRDPLAALAATFRTGHIRRHGAAIALIGPPNAGKSSLFNRLLERERAIVTPLPGTTRDTVEESLALGGIPLRLIDTAGLRSMPTQKKKDLSTPTEGAGGVNRATEGAGGFSPLNDPSAKPGFSPGPSTADHPPIDAAEQQGIARSREALADADLVLLLHDATQPLTPAEIDLAHSLANRPHLLIHNKIDLLPNAITPGAPHLDSERGESQAPIQTSALTGHGLDTLRHRILDQLGAASSLADSGALNNLRQQEAVTATLAALAAASTANAAHLPHELILLDLHTALRALDSLTGLTTPDDILARIFSTFCIGK